MSNQQAKGNRPPSGESKIETKAATLEERVAARVSEIFSAVFLSELMPADATRVLHAYWNDDLTSEERDTLCDRTNPGGMFALGNKLRGTLDVVGTEFPALVASHLQQKR